MSSSSSEDSGPEDRNPPKKRGKQVAEAEKESNAKRKKVEEPKKKEKHRNGDSDEEKKGKKGKKESKSKAKAKESDESDSEDGKFPLGGKRFASVSEFRGKKLIDIREWYQTDDDWKPGKKGISLSTEQFQKLLDVAPKIMKKAESD